MNEPETGPRRRLWPWLAAGVLFALLMAGGVRGWEFWRTYQDTEQRIAEQRTQLQRLARQLSDGRAEIEELREHLGESAENERRSTDAFARMQARMDDFDRALNGVTAAVAGGRSRAQLVAVEQLLLIANDRVQLAHDPAGAATALQLAQDRLSTLADPRLFEVRKAIADERSALLAVPTADRTAAALTLSGLIERVPKLPTREHPPSPQEIGQRAADSGFAQVAPSGFWARGRASVAEALSALFRVRRTDKPIAPLLSAEQQVLLGDLIELKLEAARLALLRDDTASFRGALQSAQALIEENDRSDDAGTIAARGELESLRRLDLNPPLPDISRSLGLLRAALDAQASH